MEALVDLAVFIFRRKDNSDGENVIDLIESDMLVLHLAPYGIRTFDACFDVVLQSDLVQGLSYRRGEIVEKFGALFFGVREFAHDVRVLLWVFVAETQVFEFGLDFV